MTVIEEIAQERKRQIEVEGFDAAHDDQYAGLETALAGGSYALHAALSYGGKGLDVVPSVWPWSPEWWKPKNPRRDLVRAAALIVAAIERIDRDSHKGD